MEDKKYKIRTKVEFFEVWKERENILPDDCDVLQTFPIQDKLGRMGAMLILAIPIECEK